MYVKKFEGETLDQTLQMVKQELGPDAIVLKTITNKGLKGALKKGRIEITAAVSEQNYSAKSKVDHVLSPEQREQFYKSPSSEIRKATQSYEQPRSKNGYGELGLNKVVNTVSKTSQKIKSSLDEFLSQDIHEEESRHHFQTEVKEGTPKVREMRYHQYKDEDEGDAPRAERRQHQERDVQTHDLSSESLLEIKQLIKSQQNKIAVLEQKISELNQSSSKTSPNDHAVDALSELRVTLRSLDLSDGVIRKLIQKIQFELNDTELQDADLVFDLALRELHDMVKVDMPLFASQNLANKPVITFILSDGAAGQSTFALKLSTMNKNATIIKHREYKNKNSNSMHLAQFVFGIEVQETETFTQIITSVRKMVEEGKSVVVDLKADALSADEIKKTIHALRRSFENVEVLICLSAINSEIYNRKILSKYKEIGNGVIISYVDQCMSFGSLLNVHLSHSDLPLKFFGTGASVPSDIEAATTDRILASMFNL